MADNDSGGRSPAELLRQVHALEDEIAVLRRRVATSPDRVHPLEARVARVAEALREHKMRIGDGLLIDPRAGFVYERIPKAEVEELVLEEVPDIAYEDIGGLGNQIDQIRDAVELPYLHPELFREHHL